MVEAPKPKLSKKERMALNIQRLKETGSYCARTNIEAKKGDSSLQEINDRINSAHSTEEIFMDMKTLMTSVATGKGYIRKGQSKIRKGGTPDDFLNYCTMKMCERWKKQGNILEAAIGQTKIDNWCAYANMVMFSYLVEYNKSIFDMDFTQIPLQTDKDGEISEIGVEDPKSFKGFQEIALKYNISYKSVKLALAKLPVEIKKYTIDLIYYINYNKFLDKSKKNFVLVGIKLFRRNLQNELGD